IPLLAIAGALGAASIARRELRLVALAAVAVVPAVQFVLWMQHPPRPPSVAFAPWFRAARFLHGQPPGRVLAPWSVGHLLDVDGGRAVVIDNFGTMPDEIAFERAHDAIFFSAFYSLYFQIEGLIGSRGLLPAGTYLEQLRLYAGWKRFWLAPTLLWLSASDAMLQAIVWIGLIASVAIILNLWPR